MNFCLYFPYCLTNLEGIQRKKSPYIAVEFEFELYVSVCEFDENKCSESHNLLKDANLNVSLFSIFCVPVEQFFIETRNKKLLNSLELHKNWLCESHSVLTDVRNFCPCLPHLLPDFGKIRHKICTHNAVENLEFSKTKSVQGYPYFPWWAEINIH